MGMSKNMARAYAEALKFEKTLTVDDFPNGSMVTVITEDGSVFNVRSACLKKFPVEKDNYIVVFCEHYCTMIFHVDECLYFGEL